MKAYKLFKIKNEKLYPLYIYANDEMPIGEWIEAKEGERTKSGKVKSKLGELSYRPGLHCCNIPLADHIGTKLPDGTLAQAKDTVWCEVEVIDNIDYTDKAKEIGTNAKGKVIPIKSCLREIPVDGFYYFQTNPLAKAKWIICGAIKINRILSNEEVASICRENGLEPQKLAV